MSDTSKYLILYTLVISAVGFGIAAFFVADIPGLAFGSLIGIVSIVAKVLLLERNVNKILDTQADDAQRPYPMDKRRAAGSMRAGSSLRFLLTGIGMFLSVYFFGLDGIIGCLIGSVSLTLSVYMRRLVETRTRKN